MLLWLLLLLWLARRWGLPRLLLLEMLRMRLLLWLVRLQLLLVCLAMQPGLGEGREDALLRPIGEHQSGQLRSTGGNDMNGKGRGDALQRPGREHR